MLRHLKGRPEVHRPRRGGLFPLVVCFVTTLSIVSAGLAPRVPTSPASHTPTKVLLHGHVRRASSVLAPYSPSEFWGGGSPVETCDTCSLDQVASAPGGTSTQPNQSVDPLTGDFNFTHTLFDVSAVGGSLGATLNYNSGLAQTQLQADLDEEEQNTPLGVGWSLDAMPSLSVSTAGGSTQITVNEENGAEVSFDQVASGSGCPNVTLDATRHTVYGSTDSYCAAGRVDAQLGNTSSGYVFEAQGGRETTVFDMYEEVSGQTYYEPTSGGNPDDTTDITYASNVAPGSGGCPSDGEYTCTTMTDTASRVTAILLDEEGRIVGVTDPLHHQDYAFGYTSLGDFGISELTSISGPSGEDWSFGYEGGSPTVDQLNLTTVTDPDNDSTTVGYNSNGLAQSVTDPAGNETTYAYTNTCTTCSEVPVTEHTQVTYPTGEIDEDNYYDGILTSESSIDGRGGHHGLGCPPWGAHQDGDDLRHDGSCWGRPFSA